MRHMHHGVSKNKSATWLFVHEVTYINSKRIIKFRNTDALWRESNGYVCRGMYKIVTDPVTVKPHI